MSQTRQAGKKAPKESGGPAQEAFRYPAAESTGFLVRAANRAFQRALEERITLRGVTPGQWYFLRVLWERDGLSQRDLSAQVGMTEPTTVVALNSMEKAKFIRRVRSETDRRKVHVFLTQKGRRLRDVMLPLAKEVNDIATGGVRAAELEAVQATLRRMIDNLQASRD